MLRHTQIQCSGNNDSIIIKRHKRRILFTTSTVWLLFDYDALMCAGPLYHKKHISSWICLSVLGSVIIIIIIIKKALASHNSWAPLVLYLSTNDSVWLFLCRKTFYATVFHQYTTIWIWSSDWENLMRQILIHIMFIIYNKLCIFFCSVSVLTEVLFSWDQSGADQAQSVEDWPHRTQGPRHNWW